MKARLAALIAALVPALAQAAEHCVMSCVSERLYIERVVKWDSVVKSGIQWWLTRRPLRNASAKNRSMFEEVLDFEMPIDILKMGERGAVVQAEFDVEEFNGSFLSGRRRRPSYIGPMTLLESDSLVAMPDFETAVEQCVATAAARA